ncbi:MAG: riboflavin synthase [Gammaproteobacteria bacterium]|nr:riboflavin synthase [Gammaproteobacteria bacterium]
MFSGIVEAVGKITFLQNVNDCLNISISPNKRFNDLVIGDSVSVNGVCLTVIQIENETFTVTAVPETLRLTNLCTLNMGSDVNLERALSANSRIGGHYVQGHIDFCGEMISLRKDGDNALIAEISCPNVYSKYLINKGYIALDGMSITVIHAEPTWFNVTFIPHTQHASIVHQYQKGTQINIEVDMMAKYIEKLLASNMR